LPLTFCRGSSADAQVTETILHSFSGPSDGGGVWAGVIFDAAGNLYGATAGGGANSEGTVFELSPISGGYEETILYSFKGKADGGSPSASFSMPPVTCTEPHSSAGKISATHAILVVAAWSIS
jgi:uncharacterized repeat protein (TIGR03803 family)